MINYLIQASEDLYDTMIHSYLEDGALVGEADGLSDGELVGVMVGCTSVGAEVSKKLSR